MAQINISLPPGLKTWADTRVATGRFSSASDYVRDLMRRDQDEVQAAARLQAAINIGRASLPSERSIEDIIAARRG